ncbi:hypothetical protein M8C21_013450 [Ambrosia artemisiifolia]|uniref:HMA domain-containing protein n=1 Tax=Ambrosia artemisiifolia TaxID=4212 RepID=A0AAD5GW90_AMBAR|nr:hypothetical protein M8C21_013450 [Ambrosia artemisiifolia]
MGLGWWWSLVVLAGGVRLWFGSGRVGQTRPDLVWFWFWSGHGYGVGVRVRFRRCPAGGARMCIEAKEGTKWTEDNVNRWKAALTEVADLKGMVLSGPETAFIAEIVHIVYSELDLKLVSCPTVLTGIEFRAQGVNPWLRCEEEQHCSPVLAICGMGGSGKTTLAKYIYNSNKQNFESSSFLEEIENKPGVLLRLQKQLLRDVLGNNIEISNVSEGTLQIERAIERKRVLIVVDDIDDSDILSTLFGKTVFRKQSKIIITTRLLNIDTWFESISWRCLVYKLELLNPHESLELLSWHAFGSNIPMEGFEKIAAELAQYCGGNPLALKVLGSSLFVSVNEASTRNNMIEIWRSRMNALNSFKGDLDHKIQGVLQRSFESLACHSHKELFLHIACFFVGLPASLVTLILENNYHAKSGIMTLINRCLVTVERDKLMMHKLLQDMAINIVREESKDTAKRSRVWQFDESYHLLSKGDGSETIEGLILNMTEAKPGMTSDKYEIELGVSFNRESETDKMEKAVSSLEGVESVSIHKEIGRLIVVGRVDVQAVATRVREFEKFVQVLRYRPV